MNYWKKIEKNTKKNAAKIVYAKKQKMKKSEIKKKQKQFASVANTIILGSLAVGALNAIGGRD